MISTPYIRPPEFMLRDITILDGGMGRQLQRMGAPFRLPEWSALALIETPDLVRGAHEAFIASGAEVITTNSYALMPPQLGEERFLSDAGGLADLAGRKAREAADGAGRPVVVAGSLPPPFESYRPELFDADKAPAILEILVAGLAPHVDLWLAETQSSIAEFRAAAAAVASTGKPLWLSATLRDEDGRTGPAQLRSGESVADAVAAAIALGAEALLFNCSQPEVMCRAVEEAAATIALSAKPETRIGVYANAFLPEPRSDEPYAGISVLREDLGPEAYLAWCRSWTEAGASIIGGCCGIGPEHIETIADHFRTAVAARR